MLYKQRARLLAVSSCAPGAHPNHRNPRLPRGPIQALFNPPRTAPQPPPTAAAPRSSPLSLISLLCNASPA